MSAEVKAIANSPILWAITIFALAIIIVQAVIYLKKSLTACKEMGVTDEQVETGIKASALASIGPSFVIVSTLLTLLVSVGAPTALMRLSYIGNMSWEMQAASRAAAAYGVQMTPEAMTPEILYTAVSCMALGCIGFLIVPIFLIKSMDKVMKVVSGSAGQALTMITSAAVLGALSYFLAEYVLFPSASTISMVVGFVVMAVLVVVEKKTGKRWISQWALTIAMFAGMFGAVLGGGV